MNFTSIVQWIGQDSSKVFMQVRFLLDVNLVGKKNRGGSLFVHGGVPSPVGGGGTFVIQS